MIDPTAASDAGLFDRLAEEFSGRLRAGERPSVDEYAARHPELARVILDLFPALAAIEGLGPEADREPERIGEFRIVRRLGEGGMGVVYEALQESLGRRVALKVLPTRYTPSSLERFRREARAASRLRHDHIVPVHGFGEAGGEPYLVMQLIDGRGLDTVLRDLLANARAPSPTSPNDDLARTRDEGASPLPPSRPRGRNGSSYRRGFFREAGWALQAAGALAYAHAEGTLHRDVKPSNLLIDVEDRLWVADFGLAKTRDADTLTRTGDLVGTLRYMAPECLKGRSDERSDVYSLGATLYEMLTLRPAFDEADRVALIEAIGLGSPVPPRRVDPTIPRDLETIVLKAMAREPGARYPSADALATDLRRYLDDRPVLARRSSAAEELWRWARRNRAQASLATSVVFLLVLLTVAASLAALAMQRSRDAALNLAEQSRMAEVERSRQLARSLLEQAKGQRLSRRPGQNLESLAILRRAADVGRKADLTSEFFDELRNQAIAALALPDIGPIPSTPQREYGAGIAVARSGGNYADDNGSDGVTIRKIADGRRVARLAMNSKSKGVYFSDDGEVAALLGEDGTVRVWDLRASLSQPAWEGVAGVSACDIRPDGRELAIGREDGSIALIDLSSRKLGRTFSGDSPPANLTYSPNGRALAISRGRSLLVYDLADGSKIFDKEGPGDGGAIAWRRDGQGLAVVSGNAVIVHHVGTARAPDRLETGTGGVLAAFTPAGDALVTTGWDEVCRLWDVRSGDLMLSVHRAASPRLDRAGRLWATTSGGLRRVPVVVSRAYRIAEPPPGDPQFYQVAVHPGGRLLAAAAVDRVVLWDLAAGQQPMRINTRCGGLAFDGQGNLFTHQENGVHRWPIALASDGVLEIGKSEHIEAPFPDGDQTITVSPDGRRIAVTEGGRVVILTPGRPGPPIRIVDQEDVRALSFSPDGRLLAAASWGANGVMVYDAETGRVVARLSEGSTGEVLFSPDGRFVAWTAHGEPTKVARVGTWKEVARAPGRLAQFTRDGRMMAVAEADATIALVVPETGRVLARLEPPNLDRPYRFAIVPDGSRLILCGSAGRLAIWNLAAVRKGLDNLGLGEGFPVDGHTRTGPPLLIRDSAAWRSSSGGGHTH